MNQTTQPDITRPLEEFDAGYFHQKVSKALADVALGVIDHGKKGKVTITLDLEQIAETTQVNVSHKISYQKPTMRGKATEEDTTTTPMHVNPKGHLSVSPETQTDIFKHVNENSHG